MAAADYVEIAGKHYLTDGGLERQIKRGKRTLQRWRKQRTWAGLYHRRPPSAL
jgi:hypothetical protein